MPSKIDLRIKETSASVNLLLFRVRYIINCLRVPPGMYSIIRYRLESVYLNSLNFTTFLCSIEARISAYFLKLLSRCLVKSFL